MDCQSTDIFEIWKALAVLTVKGVNEINKGLEDQALKLDVISNNLLKSIQIDSSGSPEKKIPKRQSKTKTGDLFAAEPSFQQPAVPPVRKTKRQASIAASNNMKNTRESATISSGASTRASRARALSSLMDIAPLDCPKANSTFVVDKKFMEVDEECLSPEMFSLTNEKSIKQPNPNTTYDVSVKSKKLNEKKKSCKNLNLIPEESTNCKKNSSAAQKSNSNDISEEPQKKTKRREKLEDIDVNIEGQSTQHMTRTMKRKIVEENQIDAKKTNAVRVPLEKQISTPLKPLDDLALTPHQVRENEAEKRKELYLKSKSDKKKFDELHLKAAKQRGEHAKFVDEKLKKTAEEKKKKEEKQKEKELMLKAEVLKKQKQTEMRLAEINHKRKLAEEAKLYKLQKAEMERKAKEAEIKKKNELKSEKSKMVATKVLPSKIPTSSPKVMGLPKSKIEKTETNKNDYGLNDVSARDSSEDESGPKKPVPSWAKRENRQAVLELQYHVDSNERDLFFNCPKTMSLKEMFKGMNIRDRQRTSSAVWNTPPRYSEYIRKN